jgi:pimeloyl-ACP methyl ester carboxylesterase
MKYFSTIIIFLLTLFYCQGQQVKIHYGNNPHAGKYYKIRGINMYCEIYGKGKPLLMIHGNGGSIEAFSKNIPFFSKHYKVIAVDSRAQGKSTDHKDSLSFEMMADDFAILLDTLKIDAAYVLGWSDGGINAIIMAMRHPKKVIKLAATGANVTADSSALIPSLWKEMTEQYQRDKNKTLATAKEKNDWKLFMLDYVQPSITRQQLHSIQCPALIIAGDRDLIAPQHTLSIFQHIPNAQLWILPNCSHSTLQDYPAEFNNKVHQFFKQ